MLEIVRHMVMTWGRRAGASDTGPPVRAAQPIGVTRSPQPERALTWPLPAVMGEIKRVQGAADAASSSLHLHPLIA